jgi:hypothetical protein
VRQVFYKCTTYHAVPKTENGYKQICNHLLTMRRFGIVPYGWIADNTRWMRKDRTYDSLEAMLNLTRETYRRALWNEQFTYVEVWLEKDALAGVLGPITKKWDVPLMVTRGYSSETFAHEAAVEINSQVSYGKQVYIYHFGDFDPSGVGAREDLEKKLARYTTEFIFTPVAVDLLQIMEWDLPTRPTKRSDPRAKNWNAPSVELDAIPADRLRLLCEEAITRHLQPDILERTLAIEEEERQTLENVIAGLNGASTK